jgi:hypothetical protein
MMPTPKKTAWMKQFGNLNSAKKRAGIIEFYEQNFAIIIRLDPAYSSENRYRYLFYMPMGVSPAFSGEGYSYPERHFVHFHGREEDYEYGLAFIANNDAEAIIFLQGLNAGRSLGIE